MNQTQLDAYFFTDVSSVVADLFNSFDSDGKGGMTKDDFERAIKFLTCKDDIDESEISKRSEQKRLVETEAAAKIVLDNTLSNAP